MKFSQAKQGRVFVIRLEDGDIVHEELERFAREQSIRAASLIAVGGADTGSRLIVGPEKARAAPIRPLEHVLENVHEISGVGTIFPDEADHPVLHMHMACGRNGKTVTGCIRSGVKTWQVMEIILLELVDTQGVRVPDPATGFKLLEL
jgi:predicted DNA-binding protein with PD1-like motif